MSTIIAKANEYLNKASLKARCHFVMSENAGRENLLLGLITAIFSTIVGTTIFAAIAQKSQALWIQIATGFMSVAAAVLAALQTFFRFSELSQQNKTAAVGYDKIKVSLDLFLLTFDPASTQTDQALAALKSITEELEKIEAASPSVPDSVFRKIVKG